jgi:protein-tyrosine phosphatase
LASRIAGEFEVVFLCTGNRFRSPMAAAFFARATDGLPVRVRSLGTLDVGPIPVLPEALEESASLGLDLSSHRACRLAGEDLSETDLVVGFERAHVAQAVVEARARRERTFTLPELVGLLAAIAPSPDLDPVERARVALQAAHEARPASQAFAPEVADPLGRPRSAQRETATRVQELVTQLAIGLFGR